MFIKSSICGVLTLLSTTSAFALTCVNDYGGTASCANNDSSAGDCVSLGYSKDSVDNCKHYIYCPFDANYKRCVAEEPPIPDCSNYNLDSCPANGICVSCTDDKATKYALSGCKSGYAENLGKSCQKTYASCEDAGYFSDNTNRTCSSTTWIYLTNGSVKNCYTSCTCDSSHVENDQGVCVKAYESCEDAGHFSSNTNRTCTGTINIYLTNGKTTKCYQGCKCKSGYVENASGSCVKAFASCKEAGYRSTTFSGANCTGIKVLLTTGETTCYRCTCGKGTHYIWGKCTNCLQQRNDCYDDCSHYQLGIDRDSCSANCDYSYSTCTQAPTTVSSGYGNGFKPSLMLALDTISEEQCKIMYSHNLTENLPDDDCAIYNA